MSDSNPFASFPPETQQAIDGLMWLGYLEESFSFAGHQFSIRTLKGEEELAASVACQEYQNTLGQVKAWAWAHVGLALLSVDNKTDFCPPIGPDKIEFARARFSYVTGRWYWPLGEYLYNRYAALQERQLAAFKAVQDLSLRSPTPSSPSSDSLTEPGTSSEQNDSPDSITT